MLVGGWVWGQHAVLIQLSIFTSTCFGCVQLTPTAVTWGDSATLPTASENRSPWQVWRSSCTQEQSYIVTHELNLRKTIKIEIGWPCTRKWPRPWHRGSPSAESPMLPPQPKYMQYHTEYWSQEFRYIYMQMCMYRNSHSQFFLC